MAKKLSNTEKSAKKEYYRNYRRQHPEKYEESQKRFWKKKAKELQNNERSEN